MRGLLHHPGNRMQADTDMTPIDDRPWYRQFWPWFIMAPPAVSVIAGLLTFYLAGAAPSMVVDDYGQIAMVTRQRAEREQRAAELGLSAGINFLGSTVQHQRSVTVTLSQAAADTPLPERLKLDLVHPTLSERDATSILAGSGGRYTGMIINPQGRYYISLTDIDGTWRLTGEFWGHDDSLELEAASRAK
jgi:hypothetical protein